MTRTRRTALTILTVAALLIAAATTATAARVIRAVQYEDSRTAAEHAIFKGGPIRVGPEVYAHANETHAVVGVESVEVVNCNLVLHLDQRPGQRVMAAVIEEDETISRLGVQAGLSGGGSKGTISFYKDGRKWCATDDRFGTVANVWVSIVTMDDPAV